MQNLIYELFDYLNEVEKSHRITIRNLHERLQEDNTDSDRKIKMQIEENSLKNGNGCSCCYGRTVVKGINDISTTNPEMVKYFVNIEDAYTHTYCSNEKVLMRCPNCNNEKKR